MANDDYRVTVEFSDPEHATHLDRRLHEQELAQELREALGDRLIVTRDGPQVFLYASSESDARAAEQAVGKLVSMHGLDATVKSAERWHPIEKSWEDASKPLPASEAETSAERDRWEQREASDSLEDDIAEWEVRIELDSHHDAVELARKLEGEGISPIVRRWKYLLIGVANEDGARGLALRLEREVPAGAQVSVEAAPVWLYEGAKRHPVWTMFGGLSGPRDQTPG
ncbi:MAG: hypothetical protein WDZ37_02265 [Solirubrobacterales bacterium]